MAVFRCEYGGAVQDSTTDSHVSNAHILPSDILTSENRLPQPIWAH